MSQSFDFAHAPGHLIRRAQQIAVAVFAEHLAAFDVTPVQFAILNALMDAPGTDQVSLASRVAFDAATFGSVIGRLETKGWVRREASPHDRRRKLLWLTLEGEKAVLTMAPQVAQVQALILQPLQAQEQQQLLGLLAKLVSAQSNV
jgi:DNA-binding MarR family transcriptional regulator